ncbi:hypothetical protein EON71_00855 [bacterium]|nr:MAG: hypothetical protein EON71_00855 [bacterium]
MTVSQLIETIQQIPKQRYIKNNTCTQIENKMKTYDKKLDNDQKQDIQEYITIVKQGKLKKTDRKKLSILNHSLINIIKENEEFNEQPNEDEIDSDTEESTIDKNDEIEEQLDSKVEKYNKFNDSHPMEGVALNGNNWRFRLKKDNIDKKSEDRDKIIKFAYRNVNPTFSNHYPLKKDEKTNKFI